MNRTFNAVPIPGHDRVMNSRRHVRLLVAIGLIAGLLPVMTWTVMAAMSTGSIQGMEGWSGGTMPIAASVDQSVDQSGTNQRTGAGRLADLEQHHIGQPQRSLHRLGVWPGPPGVRWPAVIRSRRRSVHCDAVVPLRECHSRWLQHRGRSRDRSGR